MSSSLGHRVDFLSCCAPYAWHDKVPRPLYLSFLDMCDISLVSIGLSFSHEVVLS